MKNRFLIGIPIGLALIAIAFVRGIPYIVMITLIMLFCQYEMMKAMFSAGYHPNRRTAVLFGLLLYPSYLFSPNATLLLFALLTTYNLVWGVFDNSVKFEDAIISNFIISYPGVFFLSLVFIGEIEPYEKSIFIMLIALLSPVASDVGAYFVGSKFGKKKLAPSISPNKTVEGAIGGILSSLIIIAAVYFTLLKTNVLSSYPEIVSIPWYHVLISTLLCTIFAQIGDLIASAVKRFANIKDFSNFLKSHGGVMDRVDSILFSAMVALVYFNVVLK